MFCEDLRNGEGPTTVLVAGSIETAPAVPMLPPEVLDCGSCVHTTMKGRFLCVSNRVTSSFRDVNKLRIASAAAVRAVKGPNDQQQHHRCQHQQAAVPHDFIISPTPNRIDCRSRVDDHCSPLLVVRPSLIISVAECRGSPGDVGVGVAGCAS